MVLETVAIADQMVISEKSVMALRWWRGGAFLKPRLGFPLRLCMLMSVQYALKMQVFYKPSCLHSTQSLSLSPSLSLSLSLSPSLSQGFRKALGLILHRGTE